MNWQLIVGAIFFATSFTFIKESVSNFALGLLIGCALIAWGVWKRQRIQKSSRLPYSIDGYVMAYSYDDVKFYPPYEIISKAPKGKLIRGAEVKLVQEPTNPVDHDAVALYIGDQKIGYLLRNRLQDMANEYIEKGWPVKASLVKLKRNHGQYDGMISLSFFNPIK